MKKTVIQPGVSFIIPAYNEEETIAKTLQAIQQQSYNGTVNVIVVDDGSTDNTVNIAEQEDATVLHNTTNRGLAASLNKGITAADTKYVCILHADCVPREDTWLETVVAVAEEDPDIAVVSSHQYIPASIFNEFDIGSKLLFHYSYEEEISEPKDVETVTRANFKADLCRKSALETVGLFNEKDYAAAGEDIDITARLQQDGYRLVLAPTIIHHRHGARTLGFTDYLRKKMQYSEAKGANERKYGPGFKIGVWNEATKLVLYLATIPATSRYAALLILALYHLMYMKQVRPAIPWRQLPLVPAYKAAADIVTAAALVKGLVTGKQTL